MSVAPPAAPCMPKSVSSSNSATEYSSSDAITSIIQSMLSWSRLARCRPLNSVKKARTFSTGAPRRRYMARLLRIAAASRERCSREKISASRSNRMIRSKFRKLPPEAIADDGTRAVMKARTTTTVSSSWTPSRRKAIPYPSSRKQISNTNTERNARSSVLRKSCVLLTLGSQSFT